MQVLERAADLAAIAGSAFVPTMGALHDGHASLLRRARDTGLPVTLSIFVNPTQFGPNEDFSRYPRTLESDLAIALAEGVSAVFLPDIATMYPEGLEAANRLAETIPLPPVATEPGLEDRSRPGHFAGVQLVVARLFDLVRPRISVFGEKDWQQLKLVEALVRREPDRWPGLEIIPHPTRREPDGLAMSSRNRYLRPEERKRAIGVPRALQAAHAAQRVATAERLLRETLEAHGFDVEYAVVRDAETLRPVTDFSGPTRALVAAGLHWTENGEERRVRLIDNAAMTVWR